jgi:hypothetical protein
MYIVQSVLMSRHEFTQEEAREWVKKHGYKAHKVDVTQDYYRYRQVDPDSLPFTARVRTISLGKIGKLIVAYM